jgi:hypothetical protein
MNFLDLANSLKAISNIHMGNNSKPTSQIIQEIEDRLQEAQNIVAKFKIEEINSRTVEIFVDNLENVLDIVDDLGDELENRYPESDSESDKSNDEEYGINDIPDDVSIKSDVTFTEEERSFIENEQHYAFLKKFGLRPTAKRNFANCYKTDTETEVE